MAKFVHLPTCEFSFVRACTFVPCSFMIAEGRPTHSKIIRLCVATPLTKCVSLRPKFPVYLNNRSPCLYSSFELNKKVTVKHCNYLIHKHGGCHKTLW